ncbi:SurA N-terminal domain-containing protein [Bradyrhizobium erythrophlei]|uniref:Periplasmic chaperone for outer membrane proteins SurA n=1 Tax=Bradyrhizobium erythrophlei TaxID=1437360 RepID=A0A1H4M9N6_9BRAD|nr:SurA N-terminal domain-containing protein [Bradyrhizobium erythrophlei]SEB79082.1 periplasmic chaperone for outer membrane proteins SurA [Bradyrhizobium erythrophlei]
MTTARLPTRCHSLVLSSLLALFLLLGGGARLHAQTIAVMVNGEPITNFDIEQRAKLNGLTGGKNPDRKAILDDLIDEKLKIKEAKKFGVDPTANDIEQSYGGMAQRMRLNNDQLTKVLESKGIRPDTLKQRIRADMVWTSLVRGRFKESLQVGEKDVATAVKETGEAPDAEAFEYRMQPVVLIVPRGSPQSEFENRRKEADTLRERVTSCEEANTFFKSMRNAAIREIVVKTSADLPQSLRDILDKTPVGHLTPPELTKQGVEMVALCGRKATTVDTPKKREMRDKMYVQKYEAKSKAYLQEVRKAAMIEYPGGR